MNAESVNAVSEKGGQTRDDPVIRIRGLKTQFGPVVVHENLDLDVRRGEILGVIGGSGTGKSVLMRAIIGLIRPSEGTIEVFDRNVLEDEEGSDYMVRRAGVLFQDGALFSSLTVRENVEVPLKAYFPDIGQALRERLAMLKIRLVGLPANAAGKLPAELSGGMRKRSGLARALALSPELLFLDEPTAGLDPIGAAAFDELISTLQQALGLTVFLITHDLDTLYATCDRVAVLSQKKVLAIGPIEEVERTDDPWIQDYFHGPRARAAKAAMATGN